MMKKVFLALCLLIVSVTLIHAQDEEENKKSFKENLFTGGSVSVGFSNNTFLIGASPVLGYSLTNWVDAGIVVNYNYTSYRDYNYVFNDKLRQKVYGGGGFVKIYPVRFLFAQAQVEHNFIKQKLIPASGTTQSYSTSANSVLLGGGYTTGRQGRGGQPFFYVAVLFDVAGNANSPYTDGYGRTIPIIRGGLQIPLFQGGGRRE